MKDVKLCSISSVAFSLEIDAYQRLYEYIESIRERYTDNPDGEEIIADIEARIAELILSVHPADRVVTKPLIENIIKTMGSVDDICPEEESTTSESGSEQQQPPKKIKRRLYRNIDDSSIGGVCSGVAAYVGCDTAVVRLIALLLLLFGGSSFWVYIVLWIALRPAVTARQKLEMRGEPITISSIKDYYNSISREEQRGNTITYIIETIGRILMVFFKIFMVLVLVALILAFLTIAIALFAIIVSSSGMSEIGEIGVSIMMLTSVAMLLILGIYAIMQLLNSRRVSWRAIAVMGAIWLILTLGTVMVSLNNHQNLEEYINNIKLKYSSVRTI